MATPRSSAISWYSARGLESSFSIWASTRLAHLGLRRSSSTGSYEVSVYFFMFSSPLGCLLSLACIYVEVFHAPAQLALAVRQDHVLVVREVGLALPYWAM